MTPASRLTPLIAVLTCGALLAGCGGSDKKAAVTSAADGSDVSTSADATPTPAPPPAAWQGEPATVITAAKGRTLAARTATVQLIVPAKDDSGQQTELTGEGGLDLRAGKLQLMIPGDGSVEQRVVTNTIYVKLPKEATSTFGGKQWTSQGLRDAKSGPDPFDLAASNPADLLTAVGGVSGANVVGEESVRGARALHLTASIDLTKAQHAGLNAAFARKLQPQGRGTLAADVWVDASGRISQLTLKPAGQTTPTKLELWDFGHGKVNFTAPPANQVINAAQLAALPPAD